MDTSLSNASSSGTITDIYIAKYDSTGVLLWANLAGGTSYDFGTSICNDSNGNAYVTGSFVNSITFGSTTLTATGDVFITKYAPDGLVIWAKKLGSISGATCNSICGDATGNIYICGEFKSSNLTIGTTTLTNSNNSGNFSEIYVAKCTPDGSFQWAKSAGGIGNDYAYCVSADENGNAGITGGYTSPTISFSTSTLTNADNLGNSSDIYLTSYGSDGTVLQAKSIGGSSDDFGKSLALDASGYVYLTGYFKSASMDLGTFTLTNAGDNDLFIAKYNGPTTGVTEAFTNTQLNISPNPTNSSITLSMPSLKNSKVSICTLTGTEIGTYNTQNSSTQTIDISHLSSGVYFVSLKSEEGVLTKKIIKQ